MISRDFIPMQEKVEMYFKVNFAYKFSVFANAFMKKYNDPNGWVVTTICKVSQLDDDRFAFVRRYDSTMSSNPYYERIIYDRENKLIEASMLDDENMDNPRMAERCVYKADGDSTIYETFLYKNPGWKSWMRSKLHAWGVDRMNTLLAKEKELIRKNKELMMQKKELMLQKKDEMLQKKDEFIKYALKSRQGPKNDDEE